MNKSRQNNNKIENGWLQNSKFFCATILQSHLEGEGEGEGKLVPTKQNSGKHANSDRILHHKQQNSIQKSAYMDY